MNRMGSMHSEVPDGPACPFLGLATDRRSHFTYPHPGHRCFVKERPASTDASRQAKYCLARDFAACDRYLARKRPPPAFAGRDRPVPAEAPVQPGANLIPGSAAPGTVVHVFRDGDSLPKLASKYGLTVEQLSTANGLARDAAVTNGTRLVIPLVRPPDRL